MTEHTPILFQKIDALVTSMTELATRLAVLETQLANQADRLYPSLLVELKDCQMDLKGLERRIDGLDNFRAKVYGWIAAASAGAALATSLASKILSG